MGQFAVVVSPGRYFVASHFDIGTFHHSLKITYINIFMNDNSLIQSDHLLIVRKKFNLATIIFIVS